MRREVHVWQPEVDGDPEFSWPPGWQVEYVEQTGSTNDDLLDRVAAGHSAALSDAPRAVLVTGFQSAGRGRRDRRWDAPAGANLLASVLFADVPADPGELMRRCGLAVVDAAQSFGVDAALKWPNDVVVDGAKLAGMLAQRSPRGPVVVGFGINIGWAPPGAARLEAATPPTMLRRILAAYDALPVDIAARYRNALLTLGREVRVERSDDELVGRAVDVTTHGQLVVEAGAGRYVIDAGDIIHLRTR